MTRDQILTVACQVGGNLGLLKTLPGQSKSLAAFFFDLVTDHIYREDWAFLRKRTTVSCDPTYKIRIADLPTDFRAVAHLRPRGVTFVGTTADDGLAQNHSIDNLMSKIQNYLDSGAAGVPAPTEFAVDEGSRVAGSDRADIYLYPVPSTFLTYDLSYYAIPAVIAGGATPIFPDHSVLVRAVAAWVKDFQREDMAVAAEQLAKRAIAEFRINHQNKGRVVSQQLKLDPNFFPTARED